MMREANQDHKYMTHRVKGNNLKPRSNLDKRGRMAEKIQNKSGSEPAALYGTYRLTSKYKIVIFRG